MNTSSRSKKFLAPLAVLLAAGALAVGSGATFTSASTNAISTVTAGSLKHTNDKADAAVFGADNMKPGDVAKGSVTITNTGSLPAEFTLTETADVNEFKTNLTMVITNDGTELYNGVFGGFEAKDLGVIAAGASETYEWVVTLHSSTGDTFQGAKASANYSWNAVQTSN
jgi:spore coat-associated protein N